MNLGEMRLRCMSRGRDPSNVLVSPLTWDQHINAAYFEFLAKSDFPMEVQFSDVTYTPGARFRDLPGGAFRVLQVFDATREVKLDPLYGWGRELKLYADRETGDPRYYRVVGPNLYLFPQPDTTRTVEVYYYGDPTPLVADADVPVIPERYHEALVVGALMASYEDDQNFESADKLLRRFRDFIDTARIEYAAPFHEGFRPLPKVGY